MSNYFRHLLKTALAYKTLTFACDTYSSYSTNIIHNLTTLTQLTTLTLLTIY